MLKLTVLTICYLLAFCKADCITVDQVVDQMEPLLQSIRDSTVYTTRTVSIGQIARGPLEYLWQVKSYSKAQDLSAELQLFLTRAAEAKPDFQTVQWFKNDPYLWVGDFCDSKRVPGTTVTLKTAQQIADEANGSLYLEQKCIPDVYAKNAKSETMRSCELDTECLEEMTKAAWIEGIPIVFRNRYYTFVKYQHHCNNFDQYFDVQIIKQLDILLAEIRVLLAAEPFKDDYRLPLLYKIFNAAALGFEGFLCDDILNIILKNPDICGKGGEPSEDRAVLQMGCLAIWSLKLKALLV